MSIEIRADEWLAQLEALSKPATDDGTFKTTVEWCKELGIGDGRLRRLLKEGMDQGQVEHCKVPRKHLNGVTKPVDAYRILRPVKGKGKRPCVN